MLCFSKEPFQEDGSFKYPTQMFGPIDMEVFTIIRLNPANLELCLVRLHGFKIYAIQAL